MATFGEQIRDALERRHMDQQQLAELMDVSVRAVNDLVNDRSRPRNRMGALYKWAPELREGETLDATERALMSIPDLPPELQEEFLRMYRESPLGRQRAG